jgi:ABC-type transporter lipoprotein component MlaA
VIEEVAPVVRQRCSVAAAVLALVLLSACAPAVQRVDWSDYDGPGAEAFRHEKLEMPLVSDPLEPFNRSVSAVNHVLILVIGMFLVLFVVTLTPIL